MNKKKIGLIFHVEDDNGNLKTTKYVHLNIDSEKDIKNYIRYFCDNHFYKNDGFKKYQVYTKYIIIEDINNIENHQSDEDDHTSDDINFSDVSKKLNLEVQHYYPRIVGI